MLVVSHDRYFLNRVCTDILAFEGDGQVAHSVGDYDYYVEKRARAASLSSSVAAWTSAEKRKAPAALKRPSSDRPRRLSFKEARELERMEADILAVEKSIARIEALFAEPDFHRKHGQRTEDLTTELAEEKQRMAALYERWQALEAIRAESSL